MLRMDQVHVIRHKVLVEGRSVRSVASEMGVSRNTVRKYVRQAVPVRVERQSRVRPVLERVGPRLEELLESWSPRTTRKQRITGALLHRQLVSEGYEVSERTVRSYFREWRRQRQEVYVPLVHRAGDEGQVDFFEVTVEVDGVRRRVWKFVMRLPYSGRDFVWFYERCDQLSFLDGHVRAFGYFDGVPARLVYDYLSAAVRRRVGAERVLTQRFQALVSHYLFEPCFARPGEGHDKGSVEARGKGIRLAHLTPVPEGRRLSEISASVLAEVEQRWRESKGELWEAESKGLGPLAEAEFEVREVLLVRVSRQSMIQVKSCGYSVPSRWAGLAVTVRLGVEDLIVVSRGEEMRYPRVRRGTRQVVYRHYLEELQKKPQAVRQVAPELLAELGKPYQRLWDLLEDRYGPREAARLLARLLGVVVDHGSQEVAAAVEASLREGRWDLLRLAKPLAPQPVEVPESLRGYEIEQGRASDYDAMLHEEAS